MDDHIYDDIIFNIHQQILDEEEAKRKTSYDDSPSFVRGHVRIIK